MSGLLAQPWALHPVRPSEVQTEDLSPTTRLTLAPLERASGAHRVRSGIRADIAPTTSRPASQQSMTSPKRLTAGCPCSARRRAGMLRHAGSRCPYPAQAMFVGTARWLGPALLARCCFSRSGRAKRRPRKRLGRHATAPDRGYRALGQTGLRHVIGS